MKGEKKSKLSILLILIIIISAYVIFHVYVCPYEKFYIENANGCNLLIYQDSIFQPMVMFSISLFITSTFTFFISDKIFKKWFTFTLWWFGFAIFLIILAPTSSGGSLPIGPTKELVSIWMSSLFVIISIIMFIWMTIKEKK